MILTKEAVLAALPKREADAHKGNCGRVLLLCGSRGYTGAAALAAMGALRSGAGLVYLGVPQSIYAIEAVKLTEPIVFPLPEVDGMLSAEAISGIGGLLAKMDAVLLGCGMGVSQGTLAVTRFVMENACCPVIVDADGINVISAHKDMVRGRTYPTILTPHPGEFARLGGRADLSRQDSAMDMARDLGAIVVLKGHNTVITDGNQCYLNPTGNPGMATGGSGDVLAGIIASLLGQGLLPLTAAACGAWLHGAAGDECARNLGYGLLPSDMVEVLPRLME